MLNASPTGGLNHPSRTFFFHLTHLMEAGVQPVFVYNGPKRPEFKRGRRVWHSAGGQVAMTPAGTVPGYNISDVIRLSRQLLDLMGFPWRQAPGEAEAECVGLEKAGIVDAVVMADGDAFAFGAVNVLKPCNKERRHAVAPSCLLNLSMRRRSVPERGH